MFQNRRKIMSKYLKIKVRTKKIKTDLKFRIKIKRKCGYQYLKNEIDKKKDEKLKICDSVYLARLLPPRFLQAECYFVFCTSSNPWESKNIRNIPVCKTWKNKKWNKPREHMKKKNEEKRGGWKEEKKEGRNEGRKKSK